MSGFVDTYILEANRNRSLSLNTNLKNSEWVNEISDGLKLDIGDEISVHSAYISDLGAEDSTIEFKNVVIQDEQQFVITEKTDTYFEPEDFESIANSTLEPRFWNRKPRNSKNQTITKTIKNIRDNEANIVINYYKNGNGEYLQSLPFYFTPGLGNNAAINPNAWKLVRTNKTTAECVGQEPVGSGLAVFPDTSKLLINDYAIQSNPAADPITRSSGILIQDGARYMIFAKPFVSYNYVKQDIVEEVVDGVTYQIDKSGPVYRDLFGYTGKYERVRDLLQMKIPTGFNSPSEVSSVLTDELQKQSKLTPQQYNYISGNKMGRWEIKNGLGNTGVSFNETSTNRLFNSGTYNDTNNESAQSFYNYNFEEVEVLLYSEPDKIRNYMSAFQYIGIKRPTVYEEGLKLKDRINDEMTEAKYPQLPRQNVGDVDTEYWYLKTPAGSLTNQTLVTLYPNGDTFRYPNIMANPSVKDDYYMRDNLNPLFTNFLQENPFLNWNETIPATPQNITTYTNSGNSPVGTIQLRIPIDPLLPIFTDYDLTIDDLTITVPSAFQHLTPLVSKIIKIDRVDGNNTIDEGGDYMLITIDGVVSIEIPDTTPVTIQRFVNGNYQPNPYVVINTGMEWTLDNLKQLRKLFKEQKRHPELFDLQSGTTSQFRTNYEGHKDIYNGETINMNTHRLLHMQTDTNEVIPKEQGVNPTLTANTLPADQQLYNTTSNGREASKPYDPENNKFTGYVNTSFGYDNVPSIFSHYGTNYNTVNTKDKDFASLPLFVKYWEEYADDDKWDKMTQQEFDKKIYPNGKNVPYKCSPETLKEKVGQHLWGGFAIRNPSSCQLVPINRRFENFAGTVDNNFSLFKSYENNKYFREVDFSTNENIDEEWQATYTNSIYDTISFIVQLPYLGYSSNFNPDDWGTDVPQYTKKYTIYTSVNDVGQYDPAIFPPIQKQILSPFFIDWWQDVLSQNIGIYPAPNPINLDYKTRRIGFDGHATGYGNAFINLYNGLHGSVGLSYAGEYEVGTSADTLIYRNETEITVDSSVIIGDTTQSITNTVIGSDDPEFAFDTTTSRFSFAGLHTPERITAKYNATLIAANQNQDDPTHPPTSGVVPIPDNLGKPCFRINKVFDFRNFCPSITPYYEALPLQPIGSDEKIMIPYNNPYVKRGEIIDSTSGIFLEQFGIDEKNWDSSFWGICGFTYGDLNIDNTGNINERITTGQLNDINLLTTNQNVENNDIGELFGPLTGVANNHNSVGFPVVLNFDPAHNYKVSVFAPIEIVSETARIEATNLPSKTLRPYYTIRSDIIDKDHFNGDRKSIMPVVSVIQKNEQYGDFFYGTSQLTFTNTFPRTITTVKTQICDPNGELANISPNSAVMYRIQKQNNASLDIVDQVLKKNKSASMLPK